MFLSLVEDTFVPYPLTISSPFLPNVKALKLWRWRILIYLIFYFSWKLLQAQKEVYWRVPGNIFLSDKSISAKIKASTLSPTPIFNLASYFWYSVAWELRLANAIASLIYIYFFKFYLFIYLFLAVLGLRFCVRAFCSCGKRGPLFIVVRGPLTLAASLVAEHRLQTCRLSSCGSRT